MASVGWGDQARILIGVGRFPAMLVLMVLFSQPGQELAYARMEDLVFEESTGMIH